MSVEDSSFKEYAEAKLELLSTINESLATLAEQAIRLTDYVEVLKIRGETKELGIYFAHELDDFHRAATMVSQMKAGNYEEVMSEMDSPSSLPGG